MKDDPEGLPSGLKGVLRGQSFKILYLFAGTQYKSDIVSFFNNLATEFDFTVHVFSIDVYSDSAQQNLLDEDVQIALLESIGQGEYGIVILIPPCHTYSRLQFANNFGPRPLRNRQYPRGFPWLRGKNKRKAEEGNAITDFCWQVLELVDRLAETQAAHVVAILKHPEDLGAASKGVPASIWAEPRPRRLTDERGWLTFAIRQGDYGSKFTKPTRFLTNSRLFDGFGWAGWPILDSSSAYLGPLPNSNHTSSKLVRKSEDPTFPSKGTMATAPPPKLCKLFANKLMITCACYLHGRESIALWLPRTPPAGVNGEPGRVSAAPTRASISTVRKAGQWAPNQVYIGRGCPRLCLPPSPWANPVPLKATRSREERVGVFRAHLSGSPALLEKVSQLGGKQLVCHCEETRPAIPMLSSTSTAGSGTKM